MVSATPCKVYQVYQHGNSRRESFRFSPRGPEDEGRYSFSNLTPYTHPPETNESLPWSELVTLDLSDFNNSGGRERLAAQLSHAVHHVGFFYVKNFGLSQEQIDRQFTLARGFFNLPLEEKQKFSVDYEKADYNGYQWTGYRANEGNFEKKVGDNIEMYNIPKFIPALEGRYSHPPLIETHLDEIEVFSKHLHNHIVVPLMVLFAIILELLDKNLLADEHAYDNLSPDHLRYMKYSKRTAEQHAGEPMQVKGHTDLGSVTLLLCQSVAGSQFLNDETQSWSYVRAQPGTITVNLADTLSFLTGGFLKSSIHRVTAPPKDQLAYERTGVLYFTRPSNDTILKSRVDSSPVLQREKELGKLKEGFSKPVTTADFVKPKQLNPNLYEGKRAKDGGLGITPGFKDQTYK
ncbi:hypothetical protein AWENTII_000670 [Aspergillus wentii]